MPAFRDRGLEAVRCDADARNVWGVCPHGRVLFIRGERYQPEFILPDGTRRFEAAEPEKWQTHMPPLVSDEVRVDSSARVGARGQSASWRGGALRPARRGGEAG